MGNNYWNGRGESKRGRKSPGAEKEGETVKIERGIERGEV